MFDSPTDTETTRGLLDSDLLQSLERQKGEAIASQRVFARIETRLKVVVRPANSSQISQLRIEGVTADISRGGCRLLLPVPLWVGDHYRLEFDATEHQLPLTFARCTRCRLLREDAFEAGMQFSTSIDLPSSLFQPQSDLLG
jgi:hypothetical protein